MWKTKKGFEWIIVKKVENAPDCWNFHWLSPNNGFPSSRLRRLKTCRNSNLSLSVWCRSMRGIVYNLPLKPQVKVLFIIRGNQNSRSRAMSFAYNSALTTGCRWSFPQASSNKRAVFPIFHNLDGNLTRSVDENASRTDVIISWERLLVNVSPAYLLKCVKATDNPCSRFSSWRWRC